MHWIHTPSRRVRLRVEKMLIVAGHAEDGVHGQGSNMGGSVKSVLREVANAIALLILAWTCGTACTALPVEEVPDAKPTAAASIACGPQTCSHVCCPNTSTCVSTEEQCGNGASMECDGPEDCADADSPHECCFDVFRLNFGTPDPGRTYCAGDDILGLCKVVESLVCHTQHDCDGRACVPANDANFPSGLRICVDN
jgi:hypothetical protein